MRRTLFCMLVSVAAFAFVPASALARPHHHHKRHHHHARIHHERFGTLGSTGSGSSSAGGGMPSSDTAGKIASFDGTKLTITLNDGSMVSGIVNSDTEIECMSSTASGENFQSDDGGGDNSSGDQGDDNGDHGDDNGDQGDNDDGNQNCTTADLTPGAIVTGAELKISSAGAVWDKVELA